MNARNSKTACETVVLVVQHHGQMSWNLNKAVEYLMTWPAQSHCLVTPSMEALDAEAHACMRTPFALLLEVSWLFF